MSTTIEWTDVTWNPVRGCTRVSEGCRNCYAERQAARFIGGPVDEGGVVAVREVGPFHGFVERTPSGPRWTGKVELIESKLRQPLTWRKPRRVFVNSMSDLFHESLPDSAIARIFDVMREAARHTFQVLTKRPERMRDRVPIQQLPNVWLGVSVEDQETADARIPVLLDTPAALRFVSYEPALGPVDFDCYPSTTCPTGWLDDCPGIDWLIAGGESGPGARPCCISWIRAALKQCRAAGVPCFVKQLGGSTWDGGVSLALGGLSHPKGGDPAEWPADLRVREFPPAGGAP